MIRDEQSSPSRAIYRRISILIIMTLAVLLLPRFGRTYEVMRGWGDQSFYMRLLDLMDKGAFKQALAANYMGPSYLAFVHLIKKTLALDSTGALVFLNRALVAAAIILPTAVYGLWSNRTNLAMASLSVFITFILSTPFMFASSIPWSHYVFGFFGVAFLIVLSFPTTPVQVFLAGAIWGTMANIRLFEAEVLAALLILFILISLLKGVRLPLAKLWPLLVSAICGLAIGYFSHALILGELHFYKQYSGMLAHESFSGSALNFRDVPVKFVQFFVDPCFYSLCSEVDYTKRTAFVFANDPGLQNWRMPFILQLPFYAAVLFVGAALLTWRPDLIRAILGHPTLFLGLGAGVGIPIGYISYLVGGADQLKYGFVRDLFFPALCLMVVAIYLLRSDLLTKGEKRLISIGTPLIAIVGLQIIPALFGFPRLSSTHIKTATAAEACDSDRCALSLSYANSAGKPLHIPFDRLAMVRIKCTDGTVNFAGIVELSKWSYSRSACAEGYEIVGLSTTTGVSRTTRDRGIGGKVQYITPHSPRP